MKKAVLIVEDDPVIRISLMDVLNDAGYPVLVAEDGLDGLKVLRSSDPLPGLVLLDIMMPNLDGYGFRQAQVQDPKMAQVPTALLSADGKVRDKAAKALVNDYLKKPVELEELLALVQKYCDDET